METPNLYFNQLESKPKLVLSHDQGAGVKCLKCDCSGLELHFWRKRCKVCTCRADDHDIALPDNHDYCNLVQGLAPGKIQIEEQSLIDLSGKLKKPKEREGKPFFKDLDWSPSENSEVVKKYLDCLPLEEKPIKGSEGAQKRKKRLQYQLPAHDCYPETAVSATTEEVKKELEKFVKKAQQNVAMAKVVEADADSLKANGFVGGFCRNKENEEAAPCRHCQDLIDPSSVAILPSDKQTQHKDAFHPNCFKCEKCDDLLVDLLYFNKNKQYLCGRHFCEQTYDRCAGCDELILDKQYTNAEEKSWHVHHFCCFGCDKSFVDEDYVAKNDQFYCLDCYLIKFAKDCFGCGEKIGAPEAFITHKDLYWHQRPKCFKCHTCSRFLQEKFIFKNNNIYCSEECRKANF